MTCYKIENLYLFLTLEVKQTQMISQFNLNNSNHIRCDTKTLLQIYFPSSAKTYTRGTNTKSMVIMLAKMTTDHEQLINAYGRINIIEISRSCILGQWHYAL